MNCSLSGEVPQEPVVSRTTGHMFERRLIEKHLASSNTCPITGGALSKDDLIAVQSGRVVPPRDLTATSVPGLLSLFQKEWDAAMLETFVLKKNMQTLRQELSQALYQHDAACRVIARLMKERDQAITAYQQVQARSGGAPSTAPAAAAASDPGDGTTVPSGVLQAMSTLAAELKSKRQKRPKKPARLASKEEAEKLALTSKHTPHTASKPGITCVDIHSVHQNVVATGGVDRNLKVFDRNTGKISATGSGHSKKVNAVAWHPTQAVLVSGSDDSTVRVWAPEGKKYVTKATFDAHSGPVTGVAVHPTGNYVASSSLDNTWKLHDLTSSTTVTSSEDASAGGKGITALAFHPDGLILSTGAGSGVISLWDMKAANNALKTLEGHSGAVESISFSENGYSMASGSADGTVRLWDLRKLKCVKTLDVGSAVHSVRFDHSGTFLAVGSDVDTRVLHVKSWSTKATLTENTDGSAVLGVALSNDARVLATVSMDRALRFYGI